MKKKGPSTPDERPAAGYGYDEEREKLLYLATIQEKLQLLAMAKQEPKAR